MYKHNSTAENVYGLSNDKNIVDPHLVKNTEWGAVAYLAKSQYGQNEQEVWINNNNSFVTGQAGENASAGETPSTNAYNVGNGPKASTTGTVYGVYDMSGGAYEYIAGYLDVADASTYAASLVNAPIQHKDIYTGGYDQTSNKYGDAIYEISGGNPNGPGTWHDDFASFVIGTCPFFLRGGYYGGTTSSGIFYFGFSNDSEIAQYGFRTAIAVL